MSKKLSSRRHFMIGTAGMGAAALLGPAARVLGANERIGVGVIGVGGRGTALLGMALRRAEEKAARIGRAKPATTSALSRNRRFEMNSRPNGERRKSSFPTPAMKGT